MARQPQVDPQASGPPRRGDSRQTVAVGERRSRAVAVLDVGMRLLGALALVLVIALLATLLLVAVRFTSFGVGVGSGLDPLGEAAQRTTTSVQRSAQDVADRLDPTHPPREALQQDTEFDELRRVPEGGSVGQSAEYILTLTTITKRNDASSVDQAQYAVVHRSYVQPRETRLFGQVIRVDRGDADYYLYKGETFRLGSDYYKVNWISIAQREIAIARYRNADGVTAPSKFELP